MLGSGASIPSPSRSVSCLGMRYDGNVYCFDACEGLQKQMMTFKLSYSKVKVIFISHLHADHYLGIPGLVYTLVMSDFTGKLKIVGPKGTLEIINSFFVSRVPSFVEIVEFTEESIVYEDKEFTVSAFKVEHINGSYGFVFQENDKRNFNEEKCIQLGIKGVMFSELEDNGKIKIAGKKEILIDEVSILSKGKKIVYTGDTIYCDNVLKHAKNSDLLIHDATFTEQHSEDAKEKRHATAKDAAKMATFTNSKKLILTHISNRYKTGEEHFKEAIEIFENTLVAEDGLEVEL